MVWANKLPKLSEKEVAVSIVSSFIKLLSFVIEHLTIPSHAPYVPYQPATATTLLHLSSRVADVC